MERKKPKPDEGCSERRDHDLPQRKKFLCALRTQGMTPDLPIFQIELECLGKVSSSEVVAMMEAAESRPGNDLQCLLCSFHARSACWSFLVQPEVCPVVMIVAEVFVHKALEMALVENEDHVIEQVPAAVPDESLGHAVLPGTLKTGRLGSMLKFLITSTTSTLSSCCGQRSDTSARSHREMPHAIAGLPRHWLDVWWR